MNSKPNRIDRTVLSFSYQSKGMAQHCNALIESLNYSIHTEIEKAIAAKIPSDIDIKLSSLEIDIGKIDESALKTQLALRIRDSLEKALSQQFEGEGFLESGEDNNRLNPNYLLRAFELFLTHGFFPSWLSDKNALEKLVLHFLNDTNHALVDLLKRHGQNVSVRQRFVQTLPNALIEKTIHGFRPKYSNWIIEFRDFLIDPLNAGPTDDLSQKERTDQIHFIILSYLIEESSPSFVKKDLIAAVLADPSQSKTSGFLLNVKYSSGIKAEIQSLFKSIHPQSDQEPLKDYKTLEDDQVFKSHQFINALNTSTKTLAHIRRDFPKAIVFDFLRDKKSYLQVIQKLKADGILKLLGVLYPNDASDLQAFVSAFNRNFISVNGKYHSEKTARNEIKQTLDAILSFQNQASSVLDFNALFLALLAGLEMDYSPNDPKIMDFIKSQEKLNGSVITERIKAAKPKSDLKRGHLSPGDQTVDDVMTTRPDPLNHDHDWETQRLKIVVSYLDTGFISDAFGPLTLSDVRRLFSSLLKSNRSVLANLIKTPETTSSLYRRIKPLLTDEIIDELIIYLKIHFKDAHTGLQSLLITLTKQLQSDDLAPLNIVLKDKRILPEILFASGGINSIQMFLFSLGKILARKSIHNADLSMALFSFSEDTAPEISGKNRALTAETDAPSLSRIYIEMEKTISELSAHFQKGITSFSSDIALKKQLLTFSMYLKLIPGLLIDTLQIRAHNMDVIYWQFKMHLPPKIADSFEKTLLAHRSIGKRIRAINLKGRTFFDSTNSDPFDLTLPIKNIGTYDRTTQKFLFTLILGNKRHFDHYLKNTSKKKWPAEITQKSKTVKNQMEVLYKLRPKALSKPAKDDFWPALVLRFAIKLSVDERPFTPYAFAQDFKAELKKALQEERLNHLFDEVIEEVQSNLKPLNFNTTTKIDVNTPDHLLRPQSEIAFYVSVRSFFDRYGFLPWWVKDQTIQEVISALNRLELKHPESLEKEPLEKDQTVQDVIITLKRLGITHAESLEKALSETEFQKKFLKKMAIRMPQTSEKELDQIFKALTVENDLWMNFRTQASQSIPQVKSITTPKMSSFSSDSLTKKMQDEGLENPSQINQALYDLEDKIIFEIWRKKHPKIADQLIDYFELSSYFYFGSMHPQQWRLLVYKFAIENDQKKIKAGQDFHDLFIHHIKRTHPQVDWKDLFLRIYQRIQTSPIEGIDRLPTGLLTILNLDKMSSNSTTPNSSNSDVENGMEIHVQNAGLILFWPFLTRLFERLNLIRSDAFISRDAQNRALFLLQDLAYSDLNFPEYELVLNKILVGMPLPDPVSPVAELTPDEKETLLSLFEGFKSNWEKVSNSTNEGIQETFIQREGFLRVAQEKVLLHVEKKGVDILIQSIPWNLTLIKLPWMEKPLHVEWI